MKPYDVKNERRPDYKIDDIFIQRWSPRSLSADNFSESDLMSLFEAARWAPSSSNGQPWRFIYALNGSPEWSKLFDLLDDFNRMWCKNAGALILLISRKKFEPKEGEEKENRHHSFDSGSAWMSLALQTRMKGLIAHGMAGFDVEKARKSLDISEAYNIEAMIAVGRQGEIENTHERMQKSEKPNNRKKVSEIISNGIFSKNWR